MLFLAPVSFFTTCSTSQGFDYCTEESHHAASDSPGMFGTAKLLGHFCLYVGLEVGAHTHVVQHLQ